MKIIKHILFIILGGIYLSVVLGIIFGVMFLLVSLLSQAEIIATILAFGGIAFIVIGSVFVLHQIGSELYNNFKTGKRDTLGGSIKRRINNGGKR